MPAPALGFPRRPRRIARVAANARPREESDGPPLDPAALAALAALGRPGTGDLAAKVARLYLQDAQASLAALRAAVAAGDARASRDAAHRLKSGSGNVGELALAALFQELERRAREGDLAGAASLLARVEAEYERVRGALEPLAAAAPGKGGA